MQAIWPAVQGEEAVRVLNNALYFLACARFEAEVAASIFVADAEGRGSVVGASVTEAGSVATADEDVDLMDFVPAEVVTIADEEYPVAEGIVEALVILCEDEGIDEEPEDSAEVGSGEKVSVTIDAVLAKTALDEVVIKGNSREEELVDMVADEGSINDEAVVGTEFEVCPNTEVLFAEDDEAVTFEIELAPINVLEVLEVLNRLDVLDVLVLEVLEGLDVLVVLDVVVLEELEMLEGVDELVVPDIAVLEELEVLVGLDVPVVLEVIDSRDVVDDLVKVRAAEDIEEAEVIVVIRLGAELDAEVVVEMDTGTRTVSAIVVDASVSSEMDDTKGSGFMITGIVADAGAEVVFKYGASLGTLWICISTVYGPYFDGDNYRP
ncbi:MAG: hypothetical protein M1818_000686 [Claussenomyces sp. TS43310]|nr:MAG: hypothetical protein M1818_000686 [Claussenomyces sp. TS43310]